MRLLYEHRTKTEDKGRLYVPRSGIWTKPNTWLEPDLFYIAANTDVQLDGEYYTSADLVVEVLSTESAVYDRNTKADTYAALNVKELWLVDEQLIEVRVLNGDGYESRVFEFEDQLISTVLPGFECAVREIFKD